MCQHMLLGCLQGTQLGAALLEVLRATSLAQSCATYGSLLLRPSLHHLPLLATGQQMPHSPLPSLRLIVVKIYHDAGVLSRRQRYQETHICSPTTRMCMGI